MEEKKEKKSKKWIFLVILLLIIAGIGYGWYSYKFEVVVKYNNGLDNTVENIRYYGKVDESLLNEHLTREGYTYKGFYETYILSSSEIETLKKDPTIVGSMCREGFHLDYSNYKCTSSKEYDFDNNRITRDTTIEVLWNKKPEPEIPTGREENATVTLTSENGCLVGVGSEADFVAKIKGYVKDKTIKWTFPKCFTVKRISDTHYKLTRSSSCEDSEESVPKVTVTLTNGSESTYKMVYEPKLSIEVFDDTNSIKATDGVYKCKKCVINTNVASTFKSANKAIEKSADYSVYLKDKVKDKITIKTRCGQSKNAEVTY